MSEWSTVCIERSQVIISRKNVKVALKVVLILTNSVDPDEIPHHVAYHLALHCLTKYPFRGFWSEKGYFIYTIQDDVASGNGITPCNKTRGLQIK